MIGRSRWTRWQKSIRSSLLLGAIWTSVSTTTWAQRDLQSIPDPDPELERRELEVADGFEIQLYAADPLMAKPIQMNFDSRGRLWVASSEVYPQIKPGQVANDKVLVLEDADHDGKADSTTVFAEGLLIPTGVLPGDGGCYVANSTELLHLSDQNGDGKADRQRVVLSGFGTEDTHHILHTLRWGPDGALYMNQSIYIHSHIETPHGVRRMNGSGVWRFQPSTMELETFTLGLVNPWGHAWSRTGVSFQTDGAGGEGINYTFPGFVGLTSPGAVRILSGLNPGKPKLCGLEAVGGSALPDDWQENLITNDFRAHRVCRYVVTEAGSGFAAEEVAELVKSRHVAFRPIDVKQGPDGAIYIADWYNPIIQHGEVDFRDPRRDHVHGRIWRVSAKSRPAVVWTDLTKEPTDRLVALLESKETWQRQQVRRELQERGPQQVLPVLQQWLNAREVNAANSEQVKLESLWVFQAFDQIPVTLLAELLEARDAGVRAAAVRVVYHEGHHFSESLTWLTDRVEDAHARVRLEAVRALSRQSDPRACQIAMRVLDQPMDRFLEFALWTTARELEPRWLPALRAGQLDFDGNADHLTFALQAVGSADVAPVLLGLLEMEPSNPEREQTVLSLLTKIGNADQLRRVWEEAMEPGRPAESRDELLRQLAGVARERKVVPSGPLVVNAALLTSPSPETRQAAVDLIGAWRLTDQQPVLAAVALDPRSSDALRRVALHGLAELATPETLELLGSIVRNPALTDSIRLQAAAEFITKQPEEGAKALVELLASLKSGADPAPALEACLATKGAAEFLAKALAEATISRDLATLSVRAIERSGQNQAALLAAFSQAGRLQHSPWDLSPEAKQQLLADALKSGDAARGQIIYRRTQLTCQQCHGIGGAGGQVGPDLASIGASAQPDYILESILEPGKKIKENYHSLIVETDEGQIVTGIKVRETDKALILRDAKNVEHAVPLASIEERQDGGSLMPNGLLDTLTRYELLDLVRFLSELGKVDGPYTLPRETHLRSWQVMMSGDANSDQLSSLGLAHVATSPMDFEWQNAYTLVSGQLPVEDLPVVSAGPQQKFRFVRGEFEVATSGVQGMKVSALAGIQIWFDGEPMSPEQLEALTPTEGRHVVTIAVPADATEPLMVQLPK